jgi:hypothetical protein
MVKLLIAAGAAIIFFAAADTSIAQVDPAFPRAPALSDRPSIDCTRAGSTVARILCGSHDGATADWDLNSTLWALAGTLTEIQQKSFDQDQERWRGWLISKCTVTPSSAIDILSDQQRCVIAEFHSRAAKLRSTLTGGPLEESKRSPEQHAQIQELLISRGLLQAPADGEFSSSTRQAIRSFQGSIGATQTGFCLPNRTVGRVGAEA